MRRPPSLALRLTLLFGIAAVIVFSAFGWIIGRSIENHFEAEDSKELQVIVDAVQRALAAARPDTGLALLERRFEDILAGHHGASLYIAALDGDVTYASPGPDLAVIAREVDGDHGNGLVSQWTDADHTYRVLLQPMSKSPPANSQRYTVTVAVPIDHHLSFLDSFRRTLWLLVAIAVAVMGLMGWIAVRQGHAPLHDIVARIRRISANQLDTRLSPETVPAELTDLAASFNEMLERMEEAFQRLWNYSADIAHELRTPVTNLMTQTQVALSQARTIDQYREILYSNSEEYERMAQMIGDMLFLAKADNGLYELNTTDIDLAQEVQELFDYYEAWAEERGVSLVLDGDATVAGDKLMLRRALGNLLSNAIRHTPSGQTVHVYLERSDGDEVIIAVENPGPTIPPEHIPRLFERFYRVDASRQRSGDGAGLGLAIVKSIVDVHRGTITVISVESRTQFRITLPASPTRSIENYL